MNATETYAFPARALRRWRDERLTLVPEDGGGVRALFAFEGSTCGNVAFRLVYAVRLAPASDQHRILALSCAPAVGDDGHTRTCDYLAEPQEMLRRIGDEPPLRGAPLEAVLHWQPPRSPAGCLCTAASRAHKWLAVLQTVHFALEPARHLPS